MKKRPESVNQFELSRQSFHLVIGLIIVALIHLTILNSIILLVILVIGGILSLISTKVEIPVIYRILKVLERKENIKTFPGRGALFYIAGCLLALQLFPRDIALASIIILAVGDSISTVVGRYYGKLINPLSAKKFLEGTLAGAVFAFGAVMLFVSVGWISIAWYEALLASLIAMMIEGIEFHMNRAKVDDNIVVPLVAGTVILLIRMFF